MEVLVVVPNSKSRGLEYTDIAGKLLRALNLSQQSLHERPFLRLIPVLWHLSQKKVLGYLNGSRGLGLYALVRR